MRILHVPAHLVHGQTATDAQAPLALVHAKLDGRPTGVIAVLREGDFWEPLFVYVDAELLKRLEYV